MAKPIRINLMKYDEKAPWNILGRTDSTILPFAGKQCRAVFRGFSEKSFETNYPNFAQAVTEIRQFTLRHSIVPNFNATCSGAGFTRVIYDDGMRSIMLHAVDDI